MAYASLTELKSYLGISSIGDDTLLTALLARAQKAVESYCGRVFEQTSETTRYYRADAVQDDVLWLDDDLLSVTTLTNGDAVVISSAGYWLEPRNTTPYYAIRLKSTYYWTFDTDGEVSVKGRWGYSATAPVDVAHATIRWAAYLYRQRDAQVFDVTAEPSLGMITVPKGIPADVKVLLESYRRLSG